MGSLRCLGYSEWLQEYSTYEDLVTIIALTACVTPLAAQWAQYPTPGIPRTADGKPDLTGLGDMVANIGVSNLGDLQPADVQPWAHVLVKQRAEDFGKENPHYQCLPSGPGYITAGGMKRLLQTSTMIVILNEDLTYRRIHTDGRNLEAEPNPSWMGYAVGHWDGDALVAESNGYNDRTWLQGGYPHAEALRITERYGPSDFGHLEIAVTFQDSKAYSKAWTVPIRAQLATDTELLEAVCNEARSGQEHWDGSVSDAEKSAVKVAPEVLAKYVGVYKGLYLERPRTVEVTLSGGVLFVALNGERSDPLFRSRRPTFRVTD
jgi:hypothetical protein